MDSEGITGIANCENDSRKGDVVFLHGLGGGSHSTWLYKGKEEDFFWPEQLGRDNPDLGVWTIGYGAGFTNIGNPGMLIEKRASNIGIQLSNRIGGTRPIVFVTHSMGGLIVKSLLVNSSQLNNEVKRRLVNRVQGVVFCGTPHRGSAFANAAKLLAQIVGGAQRHVQEMQINEDKLDLLHDQFISWRLKRPIMIESYAECFPVKKKSLTGRFNPLGLVVPRASANPGMGHIEDVDADHLSLVKPSPEVLPIYDVVYRGVNKFVAEAMKWAPPSTVASHLGELADKTVKVLSGQDDDSSDLTTNAIKALTNFFGGKPSEPKDSARSQQALKDDFENDDNELDD